MLLTGKAREDFESQICNILRTKYKESINDDKNAIDWINDSNDLIKNTHIIEWFESIGFEFFFQRGVDLRNDKRYGVDYLIYQNDVMLFYGTAKDLNKARVKAIKKANEIYNSKN